MLSDNINKHNIAIAYIYFTMRDKASWFTGILKAIY